jgi:Zn-dependent protease
MIRAFKLFGITVYLHWTLLILVALIAFQTINPRIPMWANLLGGIIFAIALLKSVLIHEFAHSLVGRKYGIGFSKITLFMFGGAAQMDNEITSPRSEFFMAAAGPAASFGIFVLCNIIYKIGMIVGLGQDNIAAQIILFVIYQVGYLNLMLAAFNLIVAYPLDGGRILRAIIWKFKGYYTATKVASRIGQAFGWCLIGSGILMVFGLTVPLFGTGTTNGIWIGFIGWLLDKMARAELDRLENQNAV